MDLLAERYIYRPLTTDSTNKHKNNLINIFRANKAKGGLGISHTKDFIPNGTGLEILLTTQDPQKGHHLRSIVLSGDAVIYGVAEELATIIRLLVGHSPTTLGTPRTLWTRSNPSY